jgi:hypothetical protein
VQCNYVPFSVNQLLRSGSLFKGLYASVVVRATISLHKLYVHGMDVLFRTVELNSFRCTSVSSTGTATVASCKKSYLLSTIKNSDLPLP